MKWHSQTGGNIDFGFSGRKKYPFPILQEYPSCQYLHVESERFGSKTSKDKQQGVSWNNECYYDQNESFPGEECDISQDNRENHQDHRRSNDHAQATAEEAYIVTRSDHGKIQFTCKLCGATFASQKDVKQHGTTKHGDRTGFILRH